MQSTSRQRKLTIATLIIIATTIAGLGAWYSSRSKNSYKGSPQAISIGTIVPYEKNALIYIAEDQGYFTANGIKVALKGYETGVAAADAMLAGNVDIAVASEFVVVGRSLNNKKFRIFASIAKTQDDYIFGRSDKGIKSPSDLKGKRIGLRKQTAAEFYLGRFLDRQGMNIRQVELVDVIPAKSVETFAGGDLDGIVIWQPYSHRIKTQLADKVVIWSAQNGQLMYWNMLATDTWLAGHGGAIERVLKALSEAERFLVQNPAAAKAIVQKRLGYDEGTITAIWPDTQFTMSLDQSLIVAMEDEARWMIANGSPPRKTVPDYFDYVYLKGLTAVRPEVVSIVR